MSEIAPTKEAVHALLDYLVDPMLPLRAEGKDPPSLVHRLSVSKQMHAVVLLYNYYHRKQHPELCFLEYASFCKLALALKPALIAHMKFFLQTDSAASNDLGNQLSVTEKAIMEACNISMSLYVLNDVPNTEGWPISKVAVLLVDSEKENCLLLYDSPTNGVWSVIEKSVDNSNIGLEITSEGKRTRRTMTAEQLTDSYFEQLAFEAVKEATDINHSELMVLERHVVYSLTKEKTAASFYIIQCTTNGDIQIPIKDTIDGLQGPLFKWISHGWMTTPVVEYYNVLPYATILSSWYSREVSSDSLQRSVGSSGQQSEGNYGETVSEREKVTSNGLQNVSVDSCQILENPCHAGAEKERQSNDGDCTNAEYSVNEEVITEKFKVADKEAHETEESDKSWETTHPTVKQMENCTAANCSVEETIGNENSKKADKDVQETGKHDVNRDTAHFSGNESVACEKFKMAPEQSEKSWAVNLAAMKQLENGNDEDTTGTDNSERAEIEDKETERCDALLNINHSSVKTSESCVHIDYISKDSIFSDSIDTESQRADNGIQGTEKHDGSFNTAQFSCSETAATEKTQAPEQYEKPRVISHATMEQLEKHSSEDTTVTDNSKMEEREVRETEKCGAVLDINHSTVDNLGSCIHIDYICTDSIISDAIGAENSKRADIGVRETGKLDGHCNSAQFSGNEAVDTDKSKMTAEEVRAAEQSESSRAINHATMKQLVPFCGEDTTGTDNSKRVQIEVKEMERCDELLDVINSTVENSESCVHVDYTGIESTVSDNSKRVENKAEDNEKSDELAQSTVKGLGNSITGNSSAKETIHGENCKEIKEVFKDMEVSDKSGDTMDYENSEALKEGPIGELQISCMTPNKRQKLDEGGVIMVFGKTCDKNNSADIPVRVYHHQKGKVPEKSCAYASVGGATHVEPACTLKPERCIRRKGKTSGNGINWTIPHYLDSAQMEDSLPMCLEPNCRSVETMQATLGSKDVALTQTALRFFFNKRANLHLQQRLIHDEIVSCDTNIQKIMEGHEDALALKLDAIMEGCSDACFKDKSQDELYRHGGGHHSNQSRTRKRISDAIFNLRSPTQDLNDMCYVNNWRVKHSASVVDGGHLVTVTVEGMDFDCSCSSELLSTPQEAWDSASVRMIEQLRALAGRAK